MKKRAVFCVVVLFLAVLLFVFKNRDIVSEKETVGTTPVPEPVEQEMLKNVWILASEEDGITFFYEGREQTLATRGMLRETLKDCVADLTVEGEEILSLVLKPDKIAARVLQTDETGIELEGYGEIPFAEDFKIYRLYDGLAEEPSEKLLVGTEGSEFVLENGRICAALLTQEPKLTKIRVLIGTEGFQGYYHEMVEITADCAYTVTCGEHEKTFEAGQVCSFSKESFLEEAGRKVIVPEKKEGKLTICSIQRSEGAPSYRGSLEIAGQGEGLLIVNEVTVEEYLYAVLPSEMPSDFAPEALKAQAICARSYAYTELMANRYARYGAHVDDSVSCQVYNNIGETEASILAVKDTYGQVLLFDGEVAQCYYFSTSSGYTTSATDVWENASERSYLQGKLHAMEESTETEAGGELGEAEMLAFLKQEKTRTYDSESAWYRWQTFLSLQTLEKGMYAALKTRYEAVPEQILTYEEKTESFVSKPVGELGTLEGLQIMERGKGGIVTELLVIGSREVFLVKNEYNIRTVLAPAGALIYRTNGEDVTGSLLLPSAFITLQKGTYEGETGYLVTGGGYGHGVGMSQCGADAMARCGFTCEEIIEEYYPGTTLGFLYDGV